MKNSFLLITAIVSFSILTSCVEKEMCLTIDPVKGKVKLTTNWGKIGSGIKVPDSYTVKIGGIQNVVYGITNEIPDLLDPVTHRLMVYNTPQGITVTGNTAYVNKASRDGDMLIPMPEWLFSNVQNVKIESNKLHHITAVMTQQVRQMSVILQIEGDDKDKAESITARISGIAGSYDMETDRHGMPSFTTFNFNKEQDGTWKATVRLLGAAGNTQWIDGIVKFPGGTPANIDFQSDISEEMSDFNKDKSLTLVIKASITRGQSGQGEIKSWEKIEGKDGVAL